MKRLSLFVATAILAATGLTACGSSDDSSSSSGSKESSSASSPTPSDSASETPSDSASESPSKSAEAQTATITIKDYKYSGAKTVKPGTKIKVENMDTEAHTVTAKSGGAFDVTIPPGKTAMLTAPSKPGTYPYICTFHSNMKGTLTVS